MRIFLALTAILGLTTSALALDCAATKATFVRSDGAQFVADRFGQTAEKPLRYEVLSGKMNGRRVYLALGSGQGFTGWRESAYVPEWHVRWGGKPPTARDANPTGAHGPLEGRWSLAACRS